MICNNASKMYDVTVLKVGHRWYICDEAYYERDFMGLYGYITPTLKFVSSTDEHGWNNMCIDGYSFEIIGMTNGLKLVYT